MEWLPLNEYANTHGISVSTLRRRIKTGNVVFRLQNGKYYLSPASLDSEAKKEAEAKKVKKRTTSGKILLKKKKGAFPLQGLSLEKQESLEKSQAPQPSLPWEQVVADMQKGFLQKIEQKDTEISKQKDQIADLNTLTTILEKENQSLKSLLYREKEMEEWLEI